MSITFSNCKLKKKKKPERRYFHDLVDIINDHREFQLNWEKTWNFKLSLFDTSVTLKHSQGNWKWYEQVKLNE